MTVYVVTCADPEPGGEVWAHAAYATMAQAKRVYRRLCDDTYFTVRINKLRVRPAAPSQEPTP